MTTDNDEELRKALREADPAGDRDLGGWSESEAGRRAHARIMAKLAGEPQPPPRRWTSARVAVASAAVLVIAAGIVVGVVFGTGGPGQEVVVSTSTTAASSTSTTAPSEGVEQVVALAAVVRSLEAIRASSGPQLPEPLPTDLAAYVERAEALGITLPAEREGLLAAGPVTRGTYALWIWRAFSDLLPQVREVDFADVESLSGGLQEAVLGVAGAGILDARADDRFEADQPLTAEEEKEAVTRLHKALGLVKPTLSR